MIVLVDTSVWVDFANGFASRQADTLAALLARGEDVATCGVIAAEFLQGIRKRQHLPGLEDKFRKMIWLEPRGRETYFAAARLFRDLRGRGITVRSTVDCLIARVAEENSGQLLARDRDLTAIVNSGLVRIRLLEPGTAPVVQ